MVAPNGIPVYVMGNRDMWHSFVTEGGEWTDDETGNKVASFLTGVGFGSDKLYVQKGGLKIFVQARDLFDFLLDNEEGLRKAAAKYTKERQAEWEAKHGTPAP